MKKSYFPYVISKLLNGEAVDDRYLLKKYNVELEYVVNQLLTQTAINFTIYEAKNTRYIVPNKKTRHEEKAMERALQKVEQISFQEQFLKENMKKHELEYGEVKI